MILRDVIVSSFPRTLGPPPELERREHTTLAALLESPVVTSPEPQQPAEQIAIATQPAPLTFEQVAAWLAVQDGEIRVACASLLSEELTQVHEQAKARGHEEGEAQGRAEASREAARLHASLQAIVAAANNAFDQECAALGAACADIVAEVLTKIAGPALATPAAILGAVTVVLQRVKEDRELLVRVNATDLPILQEQQAQLAQLLAGRKFTLVADARVSLGGCIVESSLGSFDGRLEVQLRELYETLRAAKAALQVPA